MEWLNWGAKLPCPTARAMMYGPPSVCKMNVEWLLQSASMYPVFA